MSQELKQSSFGLGIKHVTTTLSIRRLCMTKGSIVTCFRFLSLVPVIHRFVVLAVSL